MVDHSAQLGTTPVRQLLVRMSTPAMVGLIVRAAFNGHISTHGEASHTPLARRRILSADTILSRIVLRVMKSERAYANYTTLAQIVFPSVSRPNNMLLLFPIEHTDRSNSNPTPRQRDSSGCRRMQPCSQYRLQGDMRMPDSSLPSKWSSQAE